MQSRTTSTVLSLLAVALLATAAWAAGPASPAGDDASMRPAKPQFEPIGADKAVGDPVDLTAALVLGAGYLRHAQADITEDNAGNGVGISEVPDDPDDGGWDWVATSPNFVHSASPSPTNIYGATAQGLLQTWLATGDATLATAMDDAAAAMIANPSIRSAADLIFLMRYDDLPYVAGTTYADAARAKYDGRITTYGSATALAVYIRDARGVTQGYPNGIIGWDVGAFAVAAAMLDARYPGNGYDADADAIAEVLWQDSFNSNPGLFDFQGDKGYDPTYANVDFYWYNLGVTGLLDAFVASGSHTAELPALIARLLESQSSGGSVSYQWGANPGDEDWQSTAYAVLSLAATDQATYQRAINKMGYWLGAVQDPGSGAWIYGSGNHYAEEGGECTAALSYALPPSDAIVDDDFASQADVDVYNSANMTDFVFGYDAFNNVQDAVDSVSGTTVTVLPGTYVGQVVVSQNMTLKGTGPANTASTIIRAPAAIPVAWGARKAVIYVHDADLVYVRDLTVDGDGTGDTNNQLVGIGYNNAGGGVYGCTVTKMRHTPLNGVQGGLGIYLLNDDGTPRTMAVHGCDVNDFQKNGITLNAPNDQLVVDVVSNQVTGAGVLTYDNGDPAQNGIQVWGSAVTGAIDNNTVSGIAYDNTNNPTKYVAVCVLDYFTGVDVTNNTISDTHVGVYKIDGFGQVNDNDITINKVGVNAWGVIGSDPPRIVTSPIDDPSAKGRAPNKALLNVLVDGNTVAFAGPDNTGTFGIEVDAGYGPDDISFTATNNTVSGFEAGIEFWMCPSSCDTGVLTSGVANYNTFSGNTHGVRSNFDYITVDATCNWWGDVGGPNVPGNPSAGDAATGDLTYSPWLDGVGGACVLYGDNNVGVGNAAVCLTPSNTCVTVPVTFNRLDTTESRGVSVTIQLSPELVLCTGNPTADITIASGAGSWSNTFSNLWPEIVDNGGGSYTIDQALLGEPCGSDHGGLLFNVNVAKAPAVAVDVVGTVTVTAVDVRDCANAPLPGIPGAVGEVSINVTIPDVLADLTATQLKTGNDSDGTTKIDLAWTAPGGDAALIDLWRKGYGDYPEYNDGTGAIPTAPLTPLAVGWTHVATVAATTTSYQDEPTTRDFWYYTAFVTDECGNVSAASALTGGTLNYHLGDVVGGGDNLVNTSDMSLLGFYYGNTGIPYGDTVRNILDVGPTTNYSVNALPTTDNRIQFEDLMMFAINHDQVSKVQWPTAPAAVNAITLAPETPGAVGSTFDVAVVMSAKGDIQGLSVPLTWDAAVAVPVDMKPGDLLPAQGDLAMVLSPEPGTVDAAVMGVGDRGISGQGTLATITFRVVSAGDPRLGLGNVTARDNANQPVELNGGGSNLPPVTLPSMSELRANVPNPFNPSTEFSFVLSQDGPVTLRIYTMRGELVRTLLSQDMVAGTHALTWNGMNDQGRQVASGAYIVRFVAPDRTQSRHITLLK